MLNPDFKNEVKSKVNLVSISLSTIDEFIGVSNGVPFPLDYCVYKYNKINAEFINNHRFSR